MFQKSGKQVPVSKNKKKKKKEKDKDKGSVAGSENSHKKVKRSFFSRKKKASKVKYVTIV